MTTTWSPLFRWGVYVGLCLPRRIAATPEARRPSTWSVASTTNHSLFRSAAFAVHVFCLLISLFLGFPSKSLPPESARRREPCAAPGGGPALEGALAPRPAAALHGRPQPARPRCCAPCRAESPPRPAPARRNRPAA